MSDSVTHSLNHSLNRSVTHSLGEEEGKGRGREKDAVGTVSWGVCGYDQIQLSVCSGDWTWR